MKFRKSSNYHLVSECGEYSIAKVIVQEAVQYEAWFGKTPLASKLTTSAAAVEACRNHKTNAANAA